MKWQIEYLESYLSGLRFPLVLQIQLSNMGLERIYSAQFSILRALTLENSFTLFVTTVYPRDCA